jgi:ABC-2 type transport system ATP-binding protein
VTVHPEKLAAARALKPMHERHVLGRSILLFDGVDDQKDGRKDDRKIDRQQLAALGDVRTPSIADMFVAMLGDKPGDKPGDSLGKAAGGHAGGAQGAR